MNELICNIFEKEKIEYFAPVDFADCKIINPRLVQRYGLEGAKTAIMMLVPYLTCDEEEDRNVSLYAVSRDYHIFFEGLFSRLESELGKIYPKHFFKGFADKSPIAEVDAACRAGLGVIGKNGLLINERYGSYVFIGEIVTDLPMTCEHREKISCIECGVCMKSCPSRDRCLSEITQTKKELSEHEKELISGSKIKWGCDICQTVCPMNRGAEKSKIEFFSSDRTPSVSPEEIEKSSDEEFRERAYSWRGKNVILRNLKLK